MRAFVVRKPFEYGVEEVPMPICAYDGVVVKVLAAAICHSDLDIICATTDSSFETSMRIAAKNAVIVMEGVSGTEKPMPILTGRGREDSDLPEWGHVNDEKSCSDH